MGTLLPFLPRPLDVGFWQALTFERLLVRHSRTRKIGPRAVWHVWASAICRQAFFAYSLSIFSQRGSPAQALLKAAQAAEDSALRPVAASLFASP